MCIVFFLIEKVVVFDVIMYVNCSDKVVIVVVEENECVVCMICEFGIYGVYEVILCVVGFGVKIFKLGESISFIVVFSVCCIDDELVQNFDVVVED